MVYPIFSRFALLLTLIIGLPGASAQVLDNTSAPLAPLSRVKALKSLENKSPQERMAAVRRLGAIGTMADTDRLVGRLYDSNEQVRQLTGVALWQIWGRSGDKDIDTLYQKGIALMEASKLREAVATFTAIIAKRPAFAEAWNKRATLHYMLGELDSSLNDCEQVIKRNPNHYGALSGYAQIYLQKGDFEQATTYFQRAFKVNPNLEGIPEVIEQLQQKMQEKRRKTI